MAIDVTAVPKVPLLELMGRLSWSAQSDPASAEVIDSLLVPAVTPRVADAIGLDARFADAAARLGYVNAMSVVPRGLAGDAGHPASRFQRIDADDRRFYQLGRDHFIADARPPQHAWAKVETFLQDGVTALMQSGLASDVGAGALHGELHYLDSFDATGERWTDMSSFLAKVCKITLAFPDYLTNYLVAGQPVAPSVRAELPMSGGAVLILEITQKIIAGEAKFLMLSAVRSTAPIACDAHSVMSFFDRAHDTIHDLYLDFSAAGS